MRNYFPSRRGVFFKVFIFIALTLSAALASAVQGVQGVKDSPQSSSSDLAGQTARGVQTLQGWYVQRTGLYRKPTDWWNTANAMTVLVDYSRASQTSAYLPAVAHTFKFANKTYGTTNFINDSNDDEGWWAMAWIDAYDLTKKPPYLAMAQTIFADMTTQWDTTTCGGGVWWSKDLKHSAYKNAITNELFLEIAASLANRVDDPGQKKQYLGWAEKEWNWFRTSGMINGNNLVNDGLNATNPGACTNNKGTTWTYNQGVILGALVELDRADHDPDSLLVAQAIARATITHLVTPSGVLNEPPGHGPDWPQFKGIFLRNLVPLYRVAPHAEYKAFVETNAESILHNDQSANHEFGQLWQGPFDSGDGTRQTSALDALIAAMEMH